MSRPPHPRLDEIAKLWATNMTVSQIATKLGLTVSAVAGAAARNRDVCPMRAPQNSNRRKVPSRIPKTPRPAPKGGTIPKRTWWVKTVPSSGFGDLAFREVAVSLAAFSWDREAA